MNKNRIILESRGLCVRRSISVSPAALDPTNSAWQSSFLFIDFRFNRVWDIWVDIAVPSAIAVHRPHADWSCRDLYLQALCARRPDDILLPSMAIDPGGWAHAGALWSRFSGTLNLVALFLELPVIPVAVCMQTSEQWESISFIGKSQLLYYTVFSQ